jgi:MFS superfamily sulfate permease-like transporter
MTYYNAITVRDRLKAMIAAAQPPPRAVILDCAVQDRLDLTSAEVLKGFLVEMQREGIAIYVAEVHTPVVEFSQRIGLAAMIEGGRRFPTVDAAVRSLEG